MSDAARALQPSYEGPDLPVLSGASPTTAALLVCFASRLSAAAHFYDESPPYFEGPRYESSKIAVNSVQKLCYCGQPICHLTEDNYSFLSATSVWLLYTVIQTCQRDFSHLIISFHSLKILQKASAPSSPFRCESTPLLIYAPHSSMASYTVHSQYLLGSHAGYYKALPQRADPTYCSLLQAEPCRKHFRLMINKALCINHCLLYGRCKNFFL
ncbi:uncharacterized protein LOC130358487 [Hyla sarda]|uniref:uncharacterized protein LOC130358487 n=1 Tax=Hyla sarda TaxID=327740 RepID=UPI0024C3BF64|nr:uncharacterized protein LOC130358487 [Hyla sarda]